MDSLGLIVRRSFLRHVLKEETKFSRDSREILAILPEHNSDEANLAALNDNSRKQNYFAIKWQRVPLAANRSTIVIESDIASVCRPRRCRQTQSGAVRNPQQRASPRGIDRILRPGWHTLIKPSRAKSRRRFPFRAKRRLLANFPTVRRLLVTRYSVRSSASLGLKTDDMFTL